MEPYRRELNWTTSEAVGVPSRVVLPPLPPLSHVHPGYGSVFNRIVSAEETQTQTDETKERADRMERKRGRVCKADGCENYIVHKGLCCRHGGGKRCSVEGCTSSAKYKGLCWKHGGSVACKIPGCNKRAKAKGVCWAHGGGTRCGHADCPKIAVSGGFCWAHGGGKRCIHDGCQKPSYERTHSFCTKHYKALQGVDYYEV